MDPRSSPHSPQPDNPPTPNLHPQEKLNLKVTKHRGRPGWVGWDRAETSSKELLQPHQAFLQTRTLPLHQVAVARPKGQAQRHFI
ncbi:hypothetical protein Cadr_000007031 [Camelus dromedarius]|uniref:Uncharacterized protein n=1 Tax=Camelus dromedarius TaxID=9838 RepID=A0A5N4E836_CAMDR|nr:hypothetical protein Cadr_000007031 [Camelus dromedarius]